MQNIVILAGNIGQTSARLERDVVSAGFEIVEVGNYPKRPPSRLIVAKRL